jgi:hypothetical protein
MRLLINKFMEDIKPTRPPRGLSKSTIERNRRTILIETLHAVIAADDSSHDAKVSAAEMLVRLGVIS